MAVRDGSLGYQPADGRVLRREVIAASAVRGLVDTLARDLPAADFGAYSGSEWLLSPGYLPDIQPGDRALTCQYSARRRDLRL